MRKNVLRILKGMAILSLSIFGVACSKEPDKHYVLEKETVADFSSVIATPGEASYGKIICLENNKKHNGTLLVTFEQFSIKKNGLVFPIYRSKDEGKTWEHISDIPALEGQELSKKWQPHLYELPCKVGTMEKGTILLAGNSFNNVETQLQLFKSTDLGETWEYVSTIVTGNSFGDAVWEPNLIATDDGILECFFADETENEYHSQKISFRTSQDGIVWSESKDAVAVNEKDKRPGMPSVTRYYDGSYILAYEIVGEDGVPNYVSYSRDGLDWEPANVKGKRVLTGETNNNTLQMYGIGCSPVTAWSPVGKDEKGTLVMSGMIMSTGQAMEGKTDYFVSYNGGEAWERIRHPIPYYKDTAREAYSNGMTFSNDGKTLYSVNTILDGQWKVVFTAVKLTEFTPDLEVDNK